MAPRDATERRGRYRSAALLLVLVLAGAATVSVATAGPTTARPTTAQPRPVVAAQPAPPDGRELFLRNCAWCHGQDAAGSQYGPSLVGVGAASAHFQLSTGRMPLPAENADPERSEPAFAPAEIDALVAYVASLGGGPPVPHVGSGDPAVGRSLYLINCASCHSSSGTGAVLPGGRGSPELYAATPTQIAEAVRVGPGLMPVFPERALTPSEVDDIAAYVETLGERRSSPGGLELDLLGPVAEGLIAFAVAMPLLLIVCRRLGKRAP